MTQRGTSTAKRRAAAVKQWTIPGFDAPFVQDELTFFERNELFGLLARTLDKALDGGTSLIELLSSLDVDEVTLQRLKRGQINQDAVLASNLAGPLLRLVGDYPDLLQDVYLIALSVPKSQRDIVREGLNQIDDETGFGIYHAFVDQNAEDLKRFGVRWWEELSQTVQRIQGSDDSPTPNS